MSRVGWGWVGAVWCGWTGRGLCPRLTYFGRSSYGWMGMARVSRNGQMGGVWESGLARSWVVDLGSAVGGGAGEVAGRRAVAGRGEVGAGWRGAREEREGRARGCALGGPFYARFRARGKSGFLGSNGRRSIEREAWGSRATAGSRGGGGGRAAISPATTGGRGGRNEKGGGGGWDGPPSP